MLPNLVGIGVQKAGTNSLYTILQKHPEVEVSYETEIHFFDLDRKYSKGIGWYEQQFPPVKDEKYLCEITPEYIYKEEALERISETLDSKTKFILMLRHPVDRAYSHYTMNKMGGVENRTFQQALEEEETSGGNKKYIQKSLYGKQLNNFLKYYSLDDIHFIWFHEFTTNQNKSITDLCDFLGIPSIELNRDVHRNQSGAVKYSSLRWIYKNNKFLDPIKDTLHRFPKMRSFLKSFLENRPKKLSVEEREFYFSKYFQKDVELLERTLGKEIKEWHGRDFVPAEG
ncbi:sulfotransferase domain-containing protein [Aliifodinibius salicampi]|uniref:Sulfotransferase domain-containing protein n=1 Tax=Fodinibius salicampi TaxID=1920655 RepID=A0ABT3PV40_9BACT|nr:sulfotransferase [Fodinibius salicampi]MCW9711729.1 sulfotransferase domain-containing protein [Fodinibius salicampi]